MPAARDGILSGVTAFEFVDAVVHLEVKQHVFSPKAGDLLDFEKVNVAGTQQWLDWASRHEVPRFVFASSIKAVRFFNNFIDEQAEPERVDPYGRSKANAETAVQAWAGARLDRFAAILRFSPIYGPGNEANLAAFARQICSGKPSLVGKGAVRKSLLSRTNAVAAIEHVLRLPGRGCEVFNVADPVALTVAEIAEMIASCCGAPKPRSIPRGLAAVAGGVGDAFERILGLDFPITTRKLKTLTEETIVSTEKLLASGFQCPQTTRDGISEMTRWIAAG